MPYTTPETFTEVFRDYYQHVISWVIKLGINPQNAEDIASSILMRFYERDALSFYDPDFQIQHGDVIHDAKFKPFLSSFVYRYVQHYREREQTHMNREGLSLNAPAGEGETWADILLPSYEDQYDGLELAEVLAAIWKRISLPDVNLGTKKTSPQLLFGLMLYQIEERGVTDAEELALLYGVSAVAVKKWRIKLRTYIAEALEEFK